MVINRWIINALFTLAFTKFNYVMAECDWTGEIPGLRAHCGPHDLYEVNCTWNIRYGRLGQCSDPENHYALATKLSLIVNLNDSSANPFNNDVNLYVKLNIENGDLNNLKRVHEMKNLVDLRIIGNNKLRDVDLNNFWHLSKLQNIILAKNNISFINTSTEYGKNKGVGHIDLSNNSITYVPKDFVNAFSQLKNLNLSHNLIKFIDRFAFQGLDNIQTLDLSYNRLYQAENMVIFQNLPTLRVLSISNNNLSKLDNFDFAKLINLEELYVNSNMLSNIKQQTFETLVQLKTLDISNNSLLHIGHCLMNLTNLQVLLIPNNYLTKIFDHDFMALANLKVLDISYNNISSIETHAFLILTNLVDVDLRHNKIKTITRNFFQNKQNIETLRLSYNSIKVIEPNAFSNIKAMTHFDIGSNNLTGVLKKGTFQGVNTFYLDLSGGNLTSIEDNAFGNQSNKLKLLFLRSNVIVTISRLVFSSMTELVVLDLSFNQLKVLDFDSGSLRKLTELYAGYNNIEFVSEDLFEKMPMLLIVKLNQNNIKEISPRHFVTNTLLRYLDISSNPRLKISPMALQNLTILSNLTLHSINTGIHFDESINATVENLDISFCGITDVKKVNIIKNVTRLFLTNNDISLIDKDSFKDTCYLKHLDLKLNKIEFIQPGSFICMKQLVYLNLEGNKLNALPYGALDGPEKIQYLSLSNNTLVTLDFKLLPMVEKLYLDYNSITYLNFEELHMSNIIELAIEGNKFPCGVLAVLRKPNISDKLNSVISAKRPNYYTENVNGIPCVSVPNEAITDVVCPQNIVHTGCLKNTLQSILNLLETNQKTLENFIKTKNAELSEIKKTMVN